LKAFTDLGSLSRLEKAQSVCTYMGYLAHGQNAFYQRREGHLSDSLWRGFESLLMMVMHTPGGAALWAERSYVFGQEFEDHIGDLMRRTPDPLARPRGVITPDFARAGEPSTPAVDQ
jgi:hypothetical protein